MFGKIIATFVGGIVGLISVAVLAFISTLFVYAGWNWGIVPAVPSVARVVDLTQAFWLSLGLSVIGSRFKADDRT